MTRQIINVGTADKGNGDPIRVAFSKANANFAELYNILSNNTGGSIITTDIIGSVFADDSTLLVNGVNGTIPYSVLSGAPTIPAAQVQSNWTASSGMGVILNKPTLFSGSYTDLTSKPTIPTLVSQLANDSGFLTSVSNISNIRSEGNINIDINLSDSTLRRWRFGEDGHLTFPQGTLLGYSDPGGFIIDGAVDKDIAIYTYSGADAHGWTFGTDGGLTFPDNTVQSTAARPFSFSVAADDSTQRAISNNESIKFTGAGGVTTSSDAEGNITITGSKVIGSWTVTAGTSTYSFTVPMDGTYVMWVKGNIANGIIIWNATLSISNTNVPAIGTQYAWNYTGGGSPILLTAIPDQIRGTAGTISTDATYAGTTSNRFDFGISNTSGASQTVYYGYTKIS